jgi:hypothetical protein
MPAKWNVSRGSSQLFVIVFSSPVSITVYANALQYLNPIQYVRGGKNLKHCSLLKFILVLNSVFPSWKLLDFVSVPGVSGSLVLREYSVWQRAGRSGDLYSIPGRGERNFSSSLCVQTGSGPHTASGTMGTGGLFPGGKARPGSDADHSPPSSAEFENE